MALKSARSVKSIQQCLCVVSRQFNTESAATSTTATQERGVEKMSVLAQLKNLTSSQLKALNQLSKSIVKSAYEQGISVAVNKEWVRSTQHLPPEINGDKLTQNNVSNTQESAASETQIVQKTEAIVNSLENKNPEISVETTASTFSGYSIPQVFSNLKINFSTTSKQNSEAAQLQVIPQWKLKKSSVVSKELIVTRTRHLLTAVTTAESIASRLKRLEDLIAHMSQHQQSKNIAVKSGAIVTLLRMRRQIHDYDTQCTLREALAMMGHVEPLPGRGIRILAMDGGGTRGVLIIELLRTLERLTGRKVCEMFDYICGVSTGAIMACLFGPHKKNLDDCAAMYKGLSSQIFNQNSFWGTGNMLWSHSYYDTPLWEQILQQNIGTTPLIKTSRDPQSPKLAAVSAIVNQAYVKPFVFRNYELPVGVPALYTGTSRAELWQAVRASAAAPSYFEEFRLGEYLHQDGGILVNNPTAIAIHEAKLLWPGEALQCVVSFGTGRSHPVDMAVSNGANSNADAYSSWKSKFTKILESATDTEAVHSMLHDLLPNNVYFRINPYLNETAGMDEIRPEKLEQLERDAQMYARRNEEKFQQVAAALTQPRSHIQRGQDWIKLQSTLLSSSSKY